MQRVADAEGDAAHELGVDEGGVHGAADVGADDDAREAHRAGLGVHVGDDRRPRSPHR